MSIPGGASYARCATSIGGNRATTPVDRYHSGTSPNEVYDMCVTHGVAVDRVQARSL